MTSSCSYHYLFWVLFLLVRSISIWIIYKISCRKKCSDFMLFGVFIIQPDVYHSSCDILSCSKLFISAFFRNFSFYELMTRNKLDRKRMSWNGLKITWANVSSVYVPSLITCINYIFYGIWPLMTFLCNVGSERKISRLDLKALRQLWISRKIVFHKSCLR